MRLSVARNRDVSIVHVEEARLTYPLLSSFFDEVREVVEKGARKLVIDLEAVSSMDSPSIGCLMDIQRLLEHHDGALKLSGLHPRVETMVRMSGVHRVVDVHRDETEALAAFGLPPDVRTGAGM